MNFNEHFDIAGHHAVLSPSNHYWLHYKDKEKFEKLVRSRNAVEKGIEDHAFACTCIKRKQRLPKSRQTLNMYVNDAIGYRMIPEQILYYSENCFGTADAIVFNEHKKQLRIHDLKTGTTKVSMDQLMGYAGLFCLEYKIEPQKIKTELRIYQSNEAIVYKPDPIEIMETVDQIILANKFVNEIKTREEETL